ncbi:MAG: LysM peptidoglycan-binding domain-containing protein [Propionibacteriales bacterium]|nr:LysM peptidoglycan-binding domain-containing protein [Propionibacteriales bacterium]
MNHVADATAGHVRGALLWAAVTAGAVALGRIALTGATGLLRAPGPDFASLLVQICSAVALVALAALWLLTTDVVREVLRPAARAATDGRRRPGPVRTLLLSACGVAALSTTTTVAAVASDEPRAPLSAEVLDGLPLPDRATGAEPPAAHHRADSSVVRVRTGDTLWAIAARSLGPAASQADVASYLRRIHATNATAIGPDPDLIHPDQQLRLPPH